jgi:hypothetical protein
MGLLVAGGVATAISAATVLESVAAVGAVLSVVGMVTKNKTLSMVGMGLGVVGGVGALASSALGASSVLASGADAAATSGDAAAASADAGAAGAGGGDAFSQVTAEAAAANPAEAAAPDAIASLSNAAPPPDGGLRGQVGDTGSTGPTGQIGASGNAADAVAPGTSGLLNADKTPGTPLPPMPPATPPTTSLPPTASQTPGGWNWGVNNAQGTATIANPGAGDDSALGGVLGFMNKNPVVALGMLQAGGSLLSGWTSTLTPAQVAALNAQAASNNAATAMTNQQRTNLAMPKATASSSPVTGTPQQLVPSSPAGLINQPPPKVTGAPA